MKVTLNTPDQLILSHKPWFFGILFSLNTLIFAASGLLLIWAGGTALWYGLALIIAGAAFGVWSFYLLVRRVQVIFDRAQSTIVIRQKSIFGYEAIEHTLSELSHADVESAAQTPSWVAKPRYRPTLVLDKGMSAGRHPIILAYSPGSEAKRIVDVINDWLSVDTVDSDSQPT